MESGMGTIWDLVVESGCSDSVREFVVAFVVMFYAIE